MAKFDSWKCAEAVIGQNTGNTLLYGPPGTGKSFAGQHGPGGKTVRNITLTDETAAAELRGHYHPVGGEFVWKDGPVVSAMRDGARIVINEVNRGGGDVLSFLLAALDNPESCAITLPSGETVRPSPGFSCVGTMNGHPSELTEALANRFSASIEILDPHPDAVSALPDDLQQAARGTVSAEGADRISLRSWLAFGSLRRNVGPEVAAQAVFGKNWQAVLDSLAAARV